MTKAYILSRHIERVLTSAVCHTETVIKQGRQLASIEMCNFAPTFALYGLLFVTDF